jgi:hypothetical protein
MAVEVAIRRPVQAPALGILNALRMPAVQLNEDVAPRVGQRCHCVLSFSPRSPVGAGRSRLTLGADVTRDGVTWEAGMD